MAASAGVEEVWEPSLELCPQPGRRLEPVEAVEVADRDDDVELLRNRFDPHPDLVAMGGRRAAICDRHLATPTHSGTRSAPARAEHDLRNRRQTRSFCVGPKPVTALTVDRSHSVAT